MLWWKIFLIRLSMSRNSFSSIAFIMYQKAALKITLKNLTLLITHLMMIKSNIFFRSFVYAMSFSIFYLNWYVASLISISTKSFYYVRRFRFVLNLNLNILFERISLSISMKLHQKSAVFLYRWFALSMISNYIEIINVFWWKCI